MILGITLFAAITGTITSVLIAERSADRPAPADPIETLRRVAELRAQGVLTEEELGQEGGPAQPDVTRPSRRARAR